MNTILRALKRAALLCTLLFLPAMSFGGFSISNGQLVDNNGTPFIMRGVNYPYTWFQSRNTQQDLAAIAATGSNTVRIVLSTGGQWARVNGPQVTQLIQWCKDLRMIAVLEVHDSTGWSEQSTAVPISNATAYWTSSDIRAAINGQENFVIINIANEPFGNNTSGNYVNDTRIAIQALRTAGITHNIMIDAANWGQDWSGTMRDNAMTLWNADTLHNLTFSVHMYEVYQSLSTVSAYMQAFDNMALPLVIGEFGPINNGQFADSESVIAEAQARGNGYVGWSWSGNGGGGTGLDMTNNFDPASLTTWGNRIVNGTNGIRATSVIASVFGTPGNNLTVSPTSLSLGSGATSGAVAVTANVTWTVTDNQTWITVSPASGSNNGSFTVSATANTGTASRSGMVTVTGGGLTRQITVTQAGQPAASLSLSPTTLSVGSAAGNSTVAVTSNVSWTVTDNQTWITVSPTSGSNNGSFTVSVTANTAAASRSGTVTVSGGGLMQQVAVSQAGTTASTLTVSPTSLSLASAQSTSTITVTSNVSWTASDDQTWLTASVASGSGNASFTVTATANTGTTSRTGTVTVAGGGLTRAITVTQAGTTANNLTVSTASISLAAAASSSAVNVTANVAWTVTDDQTWITASPTSGTGNGSFTVSATANTATTSRTGTVTVTGGGLSRLITVSQAGAGGTGGTCANPITFTGNTNNFNTTGPACYRTNQTINGWGCYNFDGRTLTVGGEARTCGQMPLTRSADGYYYFSATAGQFPWAGIFAW